MMKSHDALVEYAEDYELVCDEGSMMVDKDTRYILLDFVLGLSDSLETNGFTFCTLEERNKLDNN